MKHTIFIFLLSFCGASVYSQRVFNHERLIDVDDYDQMDTSMTCNGFRVLELRKCASGKAETNSCTFFWTKIYDSTGRMIRQVKGADLSSHKIDFDVSYKKESDTLFESLTKYPPGSEKIPNNFFVDTVIGGRKERLCLFKKDKHQNIVMRSLYKVDPDGETLWVKRFDLNNKLIAVYYPGGNDKPLREWTDTITNEYNKKIVYNAIYKEIIYKSTSIYSKNGRLIENQYFSKNLFAKGESFERRIFLYGDDGRLVRKLTVDENGYLGCEESFFYKKNALIKYTKDNDISDGYCNEEKDFDDSGNLIFHTVHYSLNNISSWKYYLNSQKLCVKREFYLNGVLRSTLFYIYK